ncbi:MAG: FAD-dependent oxidoreductase [Lachnospiraceae bacterium]|nr:FAD-dependent oxidoreductase [Lachnospiraceae bacterium]
MEKNLSRRDFMKGLAAGAVSTATMGAFHTSVLAADSASSGGSLYTPGTYTASAKGHEGTVTVTMTFDETSILEVSIDASGETESIGVPAAEKLAEKILSAQSSLVDGVSGATETSSAVQAAAANCIYQASGGGIVENVASSDGESSEEASGSVSGRDWLGDAPEISEDDILETVTTDVLVVGAGNAGLMTAARAAESGVSVMVIEKGISSMNERHWIGAVGTAEADAENVEVDKNKLAAELCRYASHRCDESLIRLWINHSGEAVDWYYSIVKQYNPDVNLHMEWDVGQGGHDTYYVPPVMHNFQDSIEENYYSEATASYGLSSLTSYALDKGAEIRYETPLVKLEQDSDGRVIGAIAQSADGSYIRITALKGVALCCGGYAYNKEMLAALNPDAYASTVEADASALNTGDGIKAAMWVGADKDPDATAMLFDRGVIAPGEVSDGNWDKSGYFHLGSQPWLKVNLNGKRFCNESVPYDFILHAAYMEPGHLYNTIYDSNWMEQVKQFQQIGCARIEPSESGGKLQIFSYEAEQGLLGSLEEAGLIQSADTLEELAEKLNIPVDTFVSTVERYNELCENGEDEDFGKEAYRLLPVNTPPYYGCRQGASLLCTLDGLRINTEMQVLDSEGNPIQGLYAAGDCSGGFFAHNYPEYIVGVAVGRTLTEGYLLGAEFANL